MDLMSVSLYRAATVVGYPLIAAYLAVRKARGKEDLNRFAERMGFASVPRPEGKLVWLHGASVGETLSMQPLIQKVQELYPDVNILVTSGTVTSAQLMEKRLTGKAFHQYIPVDCMPQVKRFVDYWKPDLALWLESEFWPNILSVISDRKIPLILINGRVSDRSFARWKKMPKFSRQLQKMFVKSFGQTQEDANRLKEIGAENTDCIGNIKFAAAPLPVEAEHPYCGHLPPRCRIDPCINVIRRFTYGVLQYDRILIVRPLCRIIIHTASTCCNGSPPCHSLGTPYQ